VTTLVENRLHHAVDVALAPYPKQLTETINQTN
jgi:hypothetical protein